MWNSNYLVLGWNPHNEGAAIFLSRGSYSRHKFISQRRIHNSQSYNSILHVSETTGWDLHAFWLTPRPKLSIQEKGGVIITNGLGLQRGLVYRDGSIFFRLSLDNQFLKFITFNEKFCFASIANTVVRCPWYSQNSTAALLHLRSEAWLAEISFPLLMIDIRSK